MSSTLTPNTAAGLGEVERNNAAAQEPVPLFAGQKSNPFESTPSLSGAAGGGLTDHGAGAAPHLPPASMQTHDTTNPAGLAADNKTAIRATRAEASQEGAPGGLANSQQGGASINAHVPMGLELDRGGEQHAGGGGAAPGIGLGLERSELSDADAAILSQFPPPSQGNDAKLSGSFASLSSAARETAGIMGAELKAAIRTAPAQISDAWSKLGRKASEMKQQHAGGGKSGAGAEMKQMEGRNV